MVVFQEIRGPVESSRVVAEDHSLFLFSLCSMHDDISSAQVNFKDSSQKKFFEDFKIELKNMRDNFLRRIKTDEDEHLKFNDFNDYNNLWRQFSPWIYLLRSEINSRLKTNEDRKKINENSNMINIIRNASLISPRQLNSTDISNGSFSCQQYDQNYANGTNINLNNQQSNNNYGYFYNRDVNYDMNLNDYNQIDYNNFPSNNNNVNNHQNISNSSYQSYNNQNNNLNQNMNNNA